ncbi:hypothetical protein QYE76_038913 [Lolium multiflorum]|uniref:F-box domain-containing protein n=1 Tax=Lolium multiflorum TaxID=4521 RepID=A0AAD8T8D6_LOLMU|nr:hypothetical protein QYE76_038913 [Lolium multiflorum]
MCVDVNLDEGLATEILVRLPARSVLRYRAICKDWLRITACQSFLRAHARRRPLGVLFYTRRTVVQRQELDGAAGPRWPGRRWDAARQRWRFPRSPMIQEVEDRFFAISKDHRSNDSGYVELDALSFTAHRPAVGVRPRQGSAGSRPSASSYRRRIGSYAEGRRRRLPGPRRRGLGLERVEPDPFEPPPNLTALPRAVPPAAAGPSRLPAALRRRLPPPAALLHLTPALAALLRRPPSPSPSPLAALLPGPACSRRPPPPPRAPSRLPAALLLLTPPAAPATAPLPSRLATPSSRGLSRAPHGHVVTASS